MGESEGRRGVAQEAERWQAWKGGHPAIDFVGSEAFAQAQQGDEQLLQNQKETPRGSLLPSLPVKKTPV